jgi:hypothetical protein
MQVGQKVLTLILHFLQITREQQNVLVIYSHTLGYFLFQQLSNWVGFGIIWSYWISFPSQIGGGKNIMQHITVPFSLCERLSRGPFPSEVVTWADFFPTRFVVISSIFEFLPLFISCTNANISRLKMTTKRNTNNQTKLHQTQHNTENLNSYHNVGNMLLLHHTFHYSFTKY